MSLPVMPHVETYSITGEKPFQYRRQGIRPGSEKKVKMIGDQCPGIAGRVGLGQNITQTSKKIIPALVREKNCSPRDSSPDDMVKSTCGIYP